MSWCRGQMPEHRHPAHEIGGHRRRRPRGAAGSLDPVRGGTPRRKLEAPGARRTPASTPGRPVHRRQATELAQHGLFHPEVVGHDPARPVATHVGLADGHLGPRGPRSVGRRRGRSRGTAQLGLGRGPEGATHRPVTPQMPREPPGIDPGHRRHAVARQERTESAGRPPVGRFSQVVAHDDPAAGRAAVTRRVLRVHAVALPMVMKL